MQDQKTPYLNLPLPNQDNTLDEDLPRLRESFALLDSNAQEQDAAIAEAAQMLQNAVPQAASQTEVNTGTEAAKYVSPATLAQAPIKASQITGVLDLGAIPATALEDLIDVENDTARFALTSASVHLGMSVRVLNDGEDTPLNPPKLYIVHDLANLGNEDGYRQYAMVVDWSSIQGKPDVVTKEDTATPATATSPGQPGVVALAAFNDTESDDKAMTPAAIPGIIGQTLGVNQTWQDVTASRALDTTYTNTTAKPIEISISISQLDPRNGINLAIDGVVMSVAAGIGWFEISGTVPPGATYTVIKGHNGGAITLLWSELRSD